MSNSPYEPWPLNEQTAKVLGLPLIALTPAAQRVANSTEWRWFDPAAAVALWQGPAWQHLFPAASLAEALARVRRVAVGLWGMGVCPVKRQQRAW
ncbi:MAG: hypothetical protein WAV07_17145 [Candidatus Contendobacter sp.]